MLTHSGANARHSLTQIAGIVMLEHDFQPEFAPDALAEMELIRAAGPAGRVEKDLRELLWSSIDNDDSMDLDQLTVARTLQGGVRILVAVADVDALVAKGSAIDSHARKNTVSVYTAAKVFPMLPEMLSTNLTSLGYNEDRRAVIVDIELDSKGSMVGWDIYQATVHNHAKLAYSSVGAWLEGRAPIPQAVEAVPGLAENLRIQDNVAQTLKAQRHERGALELKTLEARPLFSDGEIVDLRLDEKNKAHELIEDFMIAANDATARYLKGKNIPSLRRVVHAPRRWDRIVEIAAQHKWELPKAADPRALAAFLAAQREADPLRFPDLSLTIIKLLGPGEYVVESPKEEPSGHFGLAVQNYTHSTAPNRRFPDLITQRVLKAALTGSEMPYGRDDLVELAGHCTEKEDDANKVERSVAKSAAAMLLSSKIGDQFDALCTGAADKGTWVRILQPPVEGRLLYGYQGVDVGDRLRVRLIHVDVEKGYIDFDKVHLAR